tara:strand:- start:640 stop:1248 length:609 start_codon:yes stop_codon:yes gene_type:complete
MIKEIIIVGHSGHSYVIVDAIYSAGMEVKGYCDFEVKKVNPFGIKYLGPENKDLLNDQNWFVAIGNNALRAKIIQKFQNIGTLETVINNSSVISTTAIIKQGTLVGAGSIINTMARIGKGCIINTGAIVEHECRIGNFCHIAPGAVLAGNVKVGERSFIGANSVVKQGVVIGSDVIIGAGSVVINDVENKCVMVGNPAKRIS